MKFILTIAITITLASCSISSKTISLTPTSLKIGANDTINLPSYESKYSDYDGVFLEIDESMEHNASDLMMGLNEWSFFYIRKVRYVVFNPDNPDDARRIAKLATMTDKSRAVKEWLDSFNA